MKRFYPNWALLFMFFLSLNGTLKANISTAGTASATTDTVCVNGTTQLVLTGYTGTIVWQKFNGTIWVDETGPGANTDHYTVTVASTSDYRAYVTDVGNPDDSSNVLTITVLVVNNPVGVGATRCGYGPVTLTGSGQGDLKWYDSASGGNLLDTGSTFTTNVFSSTTFYLEDNINGGGGSASPILITEAELSTNDNLEIQNVSPAPVDVTGWKLAINDSYTNINLVNTIVQTLSGVLNPGDVINYNDVSGNPGIYWGNNILWSNGTYPGFTGWIVLLDNNNVLRDFIAFNWPDSLIASMSITVSGTTVTPGSIWTGNGIDISTVGAGLSLSRQGNQDSNSAADFNVQAISILASNPGINLPFTGFGCSSTRVPVTATVTAPPAVNINAASTLLCQGSATTLTAQSSSLSYTYEWLPTLGLSDSVGSTVTATPMQDITYVVVGSDATCSDVDSVTIVVGTPTSAGTAFTGNDSICTGASAVLTLSGYSGNIQWQSNDGTGWVNESGTGSNTDLYSINPTLNKDYRAFLSSGGCPADSSNVLSIDVVNVNNPVVTGASRCGPGIVNLSATGNANLYWYANPLGGNPIATGTNYSPSINGNTNYYVENRIGSAISHAGPANSAIGVTLSVTSLDYGIQFNVLQSCNLETVYIYPLSAGWVTINLRQSQGGPILNSVSDSVSVPSVKTPIALDFPLTPGTAYRLEIASGSVACNRNSAGAVWPYSNNSYVTLTGNLTPTLTTGTAYYMLYDWEIGTGCHSQRVTVTGTVTPIPPVPTISVSANVLTSSAPSGNQWYKDGLVIPGANSQSYTVTANGNYHVSVTVNGCTSFSDTLFASSVRSIAADVKHWSISPNPGDGVFMLDIQLLKKSQPHIVITDASGRVVYQQRISDADLSFRKEIDLSSYAAGIYTFVLFVNGEKDYRKLVLTK